MDGYRGVIFIMKGPPGCGKSHKAARLGGTIFSTDNFFMKNGGYKFDPKKLYTAHTWTQNRAREAMQRGITPVVIDNTNCRIRDAIPYVVMAKQYQYFPEIIESDSPWWAEIKNLLLDRSLNQDKIADWADKLANGFKFEGKIIKNVHKVPVEAIKKFFDRYSPYTIADVESIIQAKYS